MNTKKVLPRHNFLRAKDIVSGVAKAKAQGHEIIKIDTNISNAFWIEINDQIIKDNTEITIIKLASPSLAPGAINGTGSIRSIKDSTKAIETSRPI